MDGTKISRKDLFGDDSGGSSDEDAPLDGNASYMNAAMFNFIEVDNVGPETANESGDDADTASHAIEEPSGASRNEDAGMEFQLFAGAAPTVVSLAQPEEPEWIGRSVEFYTFAPSAQTRATFAAAAVSGDAVLAEALFWQARSARRPAAPDINAGYVAPRRRARPGKQTRLNRKARHERLEAERKAATQRRHAPRQALPRSALPRTEQPRKPRPFQRRPENKRPYAVGKR